MLGLTSVYDPDEHVRIGGEIGAYIGRIAEKAHRRLGVIRYGKLGTFCVIEYLTPHRDVFVDVLNLGTSLANFNRAKSDELNRRLFAPLTAEGTMEAMAQFDSDFHHSKQDENAAEHEREELISRGE